MLRFLRNITLITVSFFCLHQNFIRGQEAKNSTEQDLVEILNHYVSFSNTASHGMLIVHRLLELYNQEINKYVDLEGYQLNNFSNADLPADIFEDKDKWFYPVSPYEHYQNAIQGSYSLNTEQKNDLNARIREMRKIIVDLNLSRFTIEKILASNDFTAREGLSEAYTALENCVELYEKFHVAKEYLQISIAKVARQSLSTEQQYPALDDLVRSFNLFMHDLRSEKGNISTEKFDPLLKSIENFKNALSDISTNSGISTEILKKLQALQQDIQLFKGSDSFDEQYALYGKSYYYHNVIFLRNANHYGSGFIDRWNDLISGLDVSIVKAFEEPHFYKVIYPEKSIDLAPLSTEIQLLDQVPNSLENRTLVIKQEALTIDVQSVRIEVLDHRIVDGDIISLNFNGKWILRNHKLNAEATELSLELNPEESNYLILHAENLGSIHPNTAAIHYFINGKRTRVVLNSDLNESEMIMINVKK